MSAVTPEPIAKKTDIILWAWDRYEDLGFLENMAAGRRLSVAFYAGKIELAKTPPRLIPRQRKLIAAKNTPMIPVLHVAPARGDVYSELHASAIVNGLAQILQTYPGSAIQLDFEVFASQRNFYRTLIGKIRKKIPGVRLSVTALASWCTGDTWLKGLPIDEVVPMYFDASHRAGEAEHPTSGIVPECRAAAGLATYEKYAAIPKATRYYLFSNRAWRRDALLEMLDKIDHAQTY